MSEINRLIAEHRGWTNYSECEYLGRFGEWGEAMYPPGETEYKAIPDYEHDLNAAFPLLGDLPAGGITLEDVSWYIDGAGGFLRPLENPTPEAAAKAICMAWLELNGITTPDTPTSP